MHLSTILITALVSLCLCLGTVLEPRDINSQSPTARELIHLPEPASFFKDIVARRDGSLLVVRLDKPIVYLVDSTTGAYSIITTFSNIANVTAALGIVEYAPDVFAVSVGLYIPQLVSSTPGSFRLATLDLSKGLNADGTVTPTTLATVPAAKNLNGLAFRAPSTIYASDSTGFQIWSVDTKTRGVSLAKPPTPLFSITTVGFPLGITALGWDDRGNQLYFVNADQNIIGIIPASGSGLGAPRKIASGSTTGGVEYDDFDFDPFQGNVYITTGPTSTVNFVSRDGTQQYAIVPNLVASNATILGSTSVAFGRGKSNTDVLYITTSGELILGAQLISWTFSTT